MIKTLTEVEMARITCCVCGIVFAMPERFKETLVGNHKWFYCPNGHQQQYSGVTEAERIKKELDIAQDRCSHLETELNGTLKRLACIHKRIHAGICPECHRHFLNVERHMEKKHPESKVK